MGHFSERFNNKLLRAHNKALNTRFDSLGNKVKGLGLDPVKEKTILDILDEKYLEKHEDIRKQAVAGTLPPLTKEEEEEVNQADPGDLADPGTSLSDVLGGSPEPSVKPDAVPATPVKAAEVKQAATDKKTAAKKK